MLSALSLQLGDLATRLALLEALDFEGNSLRGPIPSSLGEETGAANLYSSSLCVVGNVCFSCLLLLMAIW